MNRAACCETPESIMPRLELVQRSCNPGPSMGSTPVNGWSAIILSWPAAFSHPLCLLFLDITQASFSQLLLNLILDTQGHYH